MDHSGREDPRLSEVKAVLQRLQGLPTEPAPVGLRPAKARLGPLYWIGGGVIAAAVLAVAYAFPNLKQPADEKSEPVGGAEKAAAKDTPAAGQDGSVAPPAATARRAPAGDTPIAGPALQPAQPKVPDTGSPLQQLDRAKPPVVRPALEAALALMTSGRVQAARQRLLAMAADGSPDVAWALARSYDPNYLGAIPAADASSDVAEATRWYRAWYAAAVKQGLVADSVSLERIIGSMQH